MSFPVQLSVSHPVVLPTPVDAPTPTPTTPSPDEGGGPTLSEVSRATQRIVRILRRPTEEERKGEREVEQGGVGPLSPSSSVLRSRSPLTPPHSLPYLSRRGPIRTPGETPLPLLCPVPALTPGDPSPLSHWTIKNLRDTLQSRTETFPGVSCSHLFVPGSLNQSGSRPVSFGTSTRSRGSSCVSSWTLLPGGLRVRDGFCATNN